MTSEHRLRPSGQTQLTANGQQSPSRYAHPPYSRHPSSFSPPVANAGATSSNALGHLVSAVNMSALAPDARRGLTFSGAGRPETEHAEAHSAHQVSDNDPNTSPRSTTAAAAAAAAAATTNNSSKVSCLACRRAKRKCHTPDTNTKCRRCNAHRLLCEYREHRRGQRKRKHGTSQSEEADGAAANAAWTESQPKENEPRLGGGGSLSMSPTRLPANNGAPAPAPAAGLPSMRPRLPSLSHLHASMSTHRSPQSSSSSGSHEAAHHHASLSMPPFSSSMSHSSSVRRPNIHFSHIVHTDDNASPFSSHITGPSETSGHATPRSTDAMGYHGVPLASSAAREHTILQKMLHQPPCPDPIAVGLLAESECSELFDFYFRYLNVTIAMLDPAIHGWRDCRQKSTLLFTAVLTVASRTVRPKVYQSCLLLANKLVAQAVESGVSNIEVVQALNILAQWKKADDSSSWRRVGYAIRMAQELKLHLKSPRPLPADEIEARHVLNKERTWLNLIIADYHLAIHHSLPRMMGEEGAADPTEWITSDHPTISTPGEIVLAPTVAFSRMCRLYADMLAGMNGDPSNLRMLRWVEQEWQRWRAKWLLHPIGFGFVPQQMSTLKLFDAYYRFHICEYRLLYAARYRTSEQVLDPGEARPLAFAFGDCTDAALALSRVFQEDFAQPGHLTYCFNLTWVSLAVTSIWLVKNYGSMPFADRSRIFDGLSNVARSSDEASKTPDDMPAYMHRLLKHLLSGIEAPSPDDDAEQAGFMAGEGGSAQHPQSRTVPTSPSLALNQTGSGMAVDSTQRMIQDDLWTNVMQGHGQHQHTPRQHQQQQQREQLGAHESRSLSSGAERVGNAGSGDLSSAAAVANGQARSGTIDDAHFYNHLFPASDDDIWKLLFPVRDDTVFL